jgi:hypothetical protein
MDKRGKRKQKGREMKIKRNNFLLLFKVVFCVIGTCFINVPETVIMGNIYGNMSV